MFRRDAAFHYRHSIFHNHLGFEQFEHPPLVLECRFVEARNYVFTELQCGLNIGGRQRFLGFDFRHDNLMFFRQSRMLFFNCINSVLKGFVHQSVFRHRPKRRCQLLSVAFSLRNELTDHLEAFVAIPDPRKPIDILSTLAGVGTATASAVLAAHALAIFPSFHELVAAQIPKLGKVAFMAAYYQRHGAALRRARGKTKSRVQTWRVERVRCELGIVVGIGRENQVYPT